MNLKLCKILRGRARGKTQGKVESQLIQGRNSLINAPGTTRYVYRAMKKAINRGELKV